MIKKLVLIGLAVGFCLIGCANFDTAQQPNTDAAKIFAEADYLVHIIVIATKKVEVPPVLPYGKPKTKEIEGYFQLSGLVLQHKDRYFILTAGHIKHPDYTIEKIEIYFRNATSEETEIWAVDEALDCALLEIKNPNFKFHKETAKLGDSSALRPGDQVFAFGSPLGIRYSVAAGHVMNLELGNKEGFSQLTLILHHAHIAPGSSGGPLVDKNGKVVGINVMLFRGYPLYLATPIDPIKEVLDRLADQKQVSHAMLKGVEVINSWDFPDSWFEKKKLKKPRPKGVVVVAVKPDSEAARSGLKVGDVILSQNGMSVEDVNRFYHFILMKAEATKSLKLEVDRDGKTLKVEVPLEEFKRPPFEPPIEFIPFE